MLSTTHKEYEITIKLRVSGEVADIVTPEHVAGNIESELMEEVFCGERSCDGKTSAEKLIGKAVSEVELWGEYYGDYEDVWAIFGDGEITVTAEEVEPEQTEEEFMDGMDKLVNGPFGSGPKNVNTSFMIYHDDGDTEIIESSVLTEKNEFIFTGFSNEIHPYFIKQMKWIDVMLESKGIYLNRKTYKTVDEIGEAPHGW